MSITVETPASEVAAPPRRSRTTIAGLCALLLAPVAGSVAAFAELRVLGDVDPASDPAAFLELVTQNAGLWTVMSVALLAMAVLTMAWVPAVWRASVERTPAWAWVAAVVGTLFAGGQMVHLVAWNALSEALATLGDPTFAASLVETMESSGFFMLIFAPYLIGAVLAAVLAAVALRRARLVPTWSVIVAVVASLGVGVLGTSNPIMIVAYPALLIAAFLPAVVRSVRG